MTREIYNEIVGNIIEDYKENNDNDTIGELKTARDGEEIFGARAIRQKDDWYLEFQNGKKDGPFTKIEYDNEYVYCTIMFSLAYRYEISGLLSGDAGELGYYAYIKKFINEHKEAYQMYKKANDEMLNAYKVSKAQRFALAELDYRKQKRRAEYVRARQTDYSYAEALAR